MREYTHWNMFRRVFRLTVGEGWQAAAEGQFRLEPGTVESTINAAADEATVLSLKRDLLAELDAHKDYLESLLTQTATMRREVICKMNDAARAAAARRMEFSAHEEIVRDLLLEGEFV